MGIFLVPENKLQTNKLHNLCNKKRTCLQHFSGYKLNLMLNVLQAFKNTTSMRRVGLIIIRTAEGMEGKLSPCLQS